MSDEVIVTIRLKEVLRRTGLKKSSIYAKMKNKTFPVQVPISEHAVGWLEHEVQAWILERVEKRNEKMSDK